MKKSNVVLLAINLALLAATTASGQTCPTPPTPWYVSGSYFWDYTPDPSCVTVTGSPAPGPASMCYGISAWETPGWTNVAYTFTIESTQTNPNWSAMAYVNLIDPNDNNQNSIDLWATVVHNNTPTSTRIDYILGSDGDVSCYQLAGPFTATAGDTVTIEVFGYNSDGEAQIDVSIPHIFVEP